ncbi:MAG: hypothetical protein DYG89_47810 [Caldilinea sp. CFX5]|nr:hypothetical protein [Caldilinea sp. CFX5]
MKKSRSQKKAELQAESERLIARLLDWEEKHERPTLTVIEEAILAMRKVFGAGMMRVVIEGQESKQRAEAAQCAECGARMRTTWGRSGELEPVAWERWQSNEAIPTVRTAKRRFSPLTNNLGCVHPTEVKRVTTAHFIWMAPPTPHPHAADQTIQDATYPQIQLYDGHLR